MNSFEKVNNFKTCLVLFKLNPNNITLKLRIR